MRLFVASAVLTAALGWSNPAKAENILSVAEILPSTSFQLRPYAGVGVYRVHHTGYDRDRPVNLEQWEWGGKLFAGTWYAQRAAVEMSYHYLNSSPFFNLGPGNAPGHEKSNALTASLLFFTPPIRWTGETTRLYMRAGASYKRITDDNGSGLVQREDGLGYVIGGGAEVAIGRYWFMRIDYEYLSKITTSSAVNVQHTPISISLGYRPQ